jgi:histidinol-phosphate/aromatic aminotransferase/cobyric acid decarboxylase-like protein
VSFPLADWINAHPDAPHHLAHSGMIGELSSLPKALADLPEPDPDALRAALGRLYRVGADRVFLCHGASEGNSVALQFLARAAAGRAGRDPRIYTPGLEYPPIPDTAIAVGFRRVADPAGADIMALSAPNNPTGRRVDPGEVASWAPGDRPVLVDQTFREFTDESPWTNLGWPNLWLTGSFTKVFGADRFRVGFVIAPEAAAEAFGEVHGLLLDLMPHHSVAAARAILAHRGEILAESRAIFCANERALRAALGEPARLAAPVYFDRGPRGLDGDRLQRAALRAGVLVCAGSFFGDPGGVRLCLTRRSFPDDLEAYLAVRARHLGRPPEFGARRLKRAPSA